MRSYETRAWSPIICNENHLQRFRDISIETCETSERKPLPLQSQRRVSTEATLQACKRRREINCLSRGPRGCTNLKLLGVSGWNFQLLCCPRSQNHQGCGGISGPYSAENASSLHSKLQRVVVARWWHRICVLQEFFAKYRTIVPFKGTCLAF